MSEGTLREPWDMLQAVFPIFQHSPTLPTITAADEGRYGDFHGTTLNQFKNRITKLRTDLGMNDMRRQHVSDEYLHTLLANDGLLEQINMLLGQFELLVDDQILSDGSATPRSHLVDGALEAQFPKLVYIWEVVLKSESTFPPDVLQNRPPLERIHTPFHDLVRYVQFPITLQAIYACQEIIESFSLALTTMVAKSIGQWKAEAQVEHPSVADIAAIRKARDPRDVPVCSEEQNRDVHSAGYNQREPGEVETGTCHEARWITASFTSDLYVDEAAAIPLIACQVCPDGLSFTSETPAIYAVIADDPLSEGSTCSTVDFQHSPKMGPFRLSDHLPLSRLDHPPSLVNLQRQSLGFLLARILFEMCHSPWIQRHWQRDMMYLHVWDFRKIDQLQLRMPCSRCEDPSSKPADSESIAAFGVLLLELEAGKEARWDEDRDLDLQSGKLSNQNRLGRVLEEWLHIRDAYRQIGQDCFDFKNLVDAASSRFSPEESHALVIYKCIFQPLFKLLTGEYLVAKLFFDGLAGPWDNLLPKARVTTSQVAKEILFDDDGTSESSGSEKYAETFMDGLSKSLQSISELRTSTEPGSIRVAVLDSGVKRDDPTINRALVKGRIKEVKNFARFSKNEQEDIYGHGTIVTKLLLKTAPMAAVYVAKICDDKSMNEEAIPDIGEAIKWAVSKKVHIISLSLGLENHYDSVEKELAEAIAKGTIIFAAASNNKGGLTKRARPARRGDVMCIHASDGFGNPGPMNPSPEDGRNFSTLGVDVSAEWNGKKLWKSGTSFATPIAAGFAATILEFVESVDYEWKVSDSQRQGLYRWSGMKKVFEEISQKRYGYDFVNLAWLWEGRDTRQVAEAIEKIISEI